MSLMDFLISMVIGLPEAFSHIYIWNKYEGDKKHKNPLIYIVTLLIISCFLSITHYTLSGYIKTLFILMVFITACKILLNKDFKVCIILPIYSMFILLISELIFVLVFMIVFSFPQLPQFEHGFLTIVPNLIMSLIYLLIGSIPLVKKTYKKIIELVSKINTKLLTLIGVLLLMTVSFLFATLYHQIDLKILLLVNTIISGVYVITVFSIFSIEDKYIKISNKYNTTLASLKEYEEILDKYKIMNHENKNDLLMIINMIIKKEKAIDKYIDKLIDVKIKDDEKVMYETSIIPSGGLRATIYSKILMMKDKKLDYKLHVDKSVRKVDLSEYTDEFVLDLCKIVSIFIDNAIEASLASKKKEILIQLFMDSEDKFNISIANTYKGSIDLSKIEVKGYTTKGEGHGYGLTLANELLNKHKFIQNTREIKKNIFVQNLIIVKK